MAAVTLLLYAEYPVASADDTSAALKALRLLIADPLIVATSK